MESGIRSPALLYNSYQSVSIFCADSSISPDWLWVPSVWNCCGLTPHCIWRKAASQAGDLLGRRVRKECRFTKKSSLHSLLTSKKNKLFPLPRLPQSVHVLKFKWPALGAINKTYFSVLPDHLLQLSPHQAHPCNSFSSSQFELFEMDLSGLEVELPAMRESRHWDGWMELLCREHCHSLSRCINQNSCILSMLSS